MKKFQRALVASVLIAVCVFALTACSAKKDNATKTDDKNVAMPAIKIGTLPSDDLLPLWVAEKEGLLKKAGLDVEIITFQSAQEQVAAVTAGEIDGIMTDMVVPVQLSAGGTPMRAVTIMQTTPAGIIASPKSGITDLKGLANVPTGSATPTILEFIYDKALTDAGVPAGQIKTEEIKKVPVRFEMLMAGQVKAAVLPWTLFSLAEKQGATPLLDQKKAESYTSTVLEFSQKFLDKPGADKAITEVLTQWDAAVEKINANPDSYRELLAEKAKLPEPLKASYKIRTYPKTALPEQKQFDAVVTWMVDKGYIKTPIAYKDLVHKTK